MSSLINMLNEIEENAQAKPAEESTTFSGNEFDYWDPELEPLPVRRPKRSILGRAAGWSLVALLLTGSGLALEQAGPTLISDSTIFGTSNASEMSQQKGTVSITSTPASAGVLIQDAFIGITPLNFDWPAGSYRLVLKLNGFHDVVTLLNVEAGRSQDLDLSLFPHALNEPAPGPVKQMITQPIPKLEPDQSIRPKISKKGAVKKVEKVTVQTKKAPISTVDRAALDYIRGGNLISSTEMDGSAGKPVNEFGFKYTIQIGAFLDQESAMALAVSWKKRGYDAYILELWGVKDPSRLWQSVRIGHLNDLEKAQAAAKALRVYENTDCYLASWNSFAPPPELEDEKPQPIIDKDEPVKSSVTQLSSPEIVGDDLGQQVEEPPQKWLDTPKALQDDLPEPVAYPSSAFAVTAFDDQPEPAAVKPSLPPHSAWSSDRGEGDWRIDAMPDSNPEPGVAEFKMAKVEKPSLTPPSALEKPEVRSSVVPSPVVVKSPVDKPVAVAAPTMAPSQDEMTNSHTIESLFQESGMFRERGEMDQAIDRLEKILSMDASHGRARRRLARIHVEMGQVAKALELLQAAVSGRNAAQLSGEDPNLAAFLAALYQREEKHWQAIDLYENLLVRYPEKGIWQMGLAISLERQSETADALRAYRSALNSGELSDKLQDFVKKRIKELQ
ncbi:MAG: PEGA domain-containing protein [Magnetococcales bacterium]|nr:PEGA domain-containing protein [Magnetococcales bacterium]